MGKTLIFFVCTRKRCFAGSERKREEEGEKKHGGGKMEGRGEGIG